MTEYHPNPFADQSTWAFNGHAITINQVLTMAAAQSEMSTLDDLLTQRLTCPMDGQACGTPCCPLTAPNWG